MTSIHSIGFREVYTQKEAARMLGFTVRQVKRLVERRVIQPSGVGNLRFTKRDLNAFIIGMNSGKIEVNIRERKKDVNA